MVRFLTYKAELSNPDRSPAKVPPRGKVVFQMKGTGETQQQIYERMKKKVGSKSG